MATGVGVADDCISVYQEIKLGRKYRAAVYKIEESQVVVERTEESSLNWEDFVDSLPTDQCRYAVFDFEFESNDGRPQNKLIFLNWAPDGAKVRDKMVSAGTKEAIRKVLDGVAKEIQANDVSDLERSEIVKVLTRV